MSVADAIEQVERMEYLHSLREEDNAKKRAACTDPILPSTPTATPQTSEHGSPRPAPPFACPENDAAHTAHDPALRAWLVKHRLERWSDGILTWAADLADLEEISDDELHELIEQLRMPKLPSRRFQVAISELRRPI